MAGSCTESVSRASTSSKPSSLLSGGGVIDCLKRSRSDERLSGCEAVGDAGAEAGAGLGAGVMAGLGEDAAAPPFAGPGAGVVEEAAAAGFGPAEAAADEDGLDAADTTTASFSSRISSSTCTGYEPYASFLCRFVGMHFVTIAAIVVHLLFTAVERPPRRYRMIYEK